MVGILLIQLGTPETPSKKECKKFISEFLLDYRVIDIPAVFRWLLVKLIVSLRVSKVSEAYQAIWLPEGSPLRVYSEQLVSEVQKTLGSSAMVRLGMTYGRPSIKSALSELRSSGVSRILVLPLFPQYASASTGACLERVFDLLRKEPNIPALEILPAFYNKDFFIQSLKEVASTIQLDSYDHFLFSFHGLPERQIEAADSSGKYCLKSANCCERKASENRYCYRHHSFETARLLAEALHIPQNKRSVSFQSRLGKTPWIRPYTDEVLKELPKKGVKKLAVFSPSFVADCLETLEEIGIRGKETFLEAGGSEFNLVSALNAHPSWVQGLSSYLKSKVADGLD